MNEITKTAFDFARQTTEQFITLATGIIALTITFSKDFVSSVENSVRFYALLSWGALLLSVLFGMLTLMALTGTLEPKRQTGPGVATDEDTLGGISPIPSIRGPNVVIPSVLQVVFFFLGLVMTVIFGIRST